MFKNSKPIKTTPINIITEIYMFVIVMYVVEYMVIPTKDIPIYLIIIGYAVGSIIHKVIKKVYRTLKSKKRNIKRSKS